MKVSREQASQNRDRVLAVAGKLFRERGFDGIGVADLMKSAGMTHGGFYGQFGSKEDLMTEVCQRSFGIAVERCVKVAGEAEGEALNAVIQDYLSQSHRDNPGEGCMMSALGAEVARRGASLRRAVTEGNRAILDLFTSLVSGRTKARKRERAIMTYASMVGALVLARAVDDAALSDEILQTVAANLSSQSGSPMTEK